VSLVAPVRRRHTVVVAATAVCAASMLILGAWAFPGFVDYAPYNRHLIHDAGAFQLGIGVSLLVALWWPDGLLVALTGFAVASACTPCRTPSTGRSAVTTATCRRSACSPSSPTTTRCSA
jgi:hypothetical protein